MLNDLEAKRIQILEERMTALEHKVNHISAPILDSIEHFRRDTLSLFQALADRLEKQMAESEARTEKRFGVMEKRFDAVDGRFDSIDKRFDEVLGAIKGGVSR